MGGRSPGLQRSLLVSTVSNVVLLRDRAREAGRAGPIGNPLRTAGNGPQLQGTQHCRVVSKQPMTLKELLLLAVVALEDEALGQILGLKTKDRQHRPRVSSSSGYKFC